MSLVAALALVFALTGVSALGPQTAQAQAQQPPTEAMQFFERARDAYREGRYPDAAVDLERALVLDPNAPALLFNLGRVYELMGRYDDAITIYMRLRAVTPATETEELARTEQILERLRGAREHAAPPPTVEVVGTIEQGPTFVRERGVADEAFWATFVTGAVITVGAAVCGVLALTMHADLRDRVLGVDGYSYQSYSDQLATAQLLGNVADIAGGVGGATIFAALLLFGLRENVYQQWPDGTRAGLRIDVGPGNLSIAGSF